MEVRFLKKKIEYHTKKWEIILQRREKLRNFILESFILNKHFRNVTLGEGWVADEIESK